MDQEMASTQEQIVSLLAKGEIYWLQMADDYQTKYSGSTDYDKGLKKAYYQKAASCRQAAERVRGSTDDPERCLTEIELSLKGSPLPLATRHEIEQRVASLKARIEAIDISEPEG